MSTKGIDVKERIKNVMEYCVPGRTRAALRAILADLDAEPPKPTGEQLKAIADIKVISGDKPTICKEGNCVWVGEEYGAGLWHYIKPNDELIGKLRWHLKDAPEPLTLMICDHAGECKGDFCCADRVPHTKCSDCSDPSCSQFSHRICVPWVRVQDEPAEQVKSCSTCGWKPNTFCLCQKFCDGFSQWKSKQPEPAEQVNKGFSICEGCEYRYKKASFHAKCVGCFGENYKPIPKEPKAEPEHFDCGGCKDRTSTQYHSCGYMCADWMHCVRTSSLLRCDWKSKEPKSQPGLVSYPIIGDKGNELWLVQRPAGAIALYKAVGRKDFAYIETEIGDKFISLQAFDDPPRRAWFRETNITDQ